MIQIDKQAIFKFNKKRDSVFLIFVLGTSIFWFLNKLSKDYSQVVYYPIKYTSLPARLFFQENPPKEIGLRIKADGFYFLGSSFNKQKINIPIRRLKKVNKFDYYILNKELKKRARNSIKDQVTVVDVLFDTLFVKLGKKTFKKVPVIANLNIDYQLGYKSFSGYKITPDSIKISGPEMQVAKVNEIQLTSFNKSKVQENISEEITIIKPKAPKITCNLKKVKLDIEVEKVTEKKIEVPLQIINVPLNEEMVIYPKKIEINCLVRLSQFNDVIASEFVIVCDYNKREDKYIKAEIKEKPITVSSVKLNTDKVEYLILK